MQVAQFTHTNKNIMLPYLPISLNLNIISITQAQTHNYKLVLSECNQFYSKLILTVPKTLRLSRETSPQFLNKNHTKENVSKKKTSPPYFLRKNPTTVYPHKPPCQFYYLFLILS